MGPSETNPRKQDSTDFVEILIDIADGNCARFDKFVDRYKNALLSYCYMELRDEHLAADLVQDVFLTVFKKVRARNWPRTWAGGDPGPFLFKIARDLGKNRRRTKFRKRLTFVSSAESDDESQQSVLDLASSNEDNPEKGVAGDDFVESVLNKLPEQDRETVRKHIWGLSAVAIAEETRTPLGTVKSRIHRGLQKLREIKAIKAVLDVY